MADSGNIHAVSPITAIHAWSGSRMDEPAGIAYDRYDHV